MADDVAGFDTFFRDEYVALIAFLRKVGFGREEAEDAAAEAMTCAYQCWGEVRNPRAWVRTAAYRTAVRQASRLRKGTLRAISGWARAEVAGEQFRVVDERMRVIDLLNLLPRQQRLVLAWHLDGFGTGEIATELGMSDATVRSHLRFARNRLKRALQRDHRGEPGSDTGREVPEHGP